MSGELSNTRSRYKDHSPTLGRKRRATKASPTNCSSLFCFRLMAAEPGVWSSGVAERRVPNPPRSEAERTLAPTGGDRRRRGDAALQPQWLPLEGAPPFLSRFFLPRGRKRRREETGRFPEFLQQQPNQRSTKSPKCPEISALLSNCAALNGASEICLSMNKCKGILLIYWRIY